MKILRTLMCRWKGHPGLSRCWGGPVPPFLVTKIIRLTECRVVVPSPSPLTWTWTGNRGRDERRLRGGRSKAVPFLSPLVPSDANILPGTKMDCNISLIWIHLLSEPPSTNTASSPSLGVGRRPSSEKLYILRETSFLMFCLEFWIPYILVP